LINKCKTKYAEKGKTVKNNYPDNGILVNSFNLSRYNTVLSYLSFAHTSVNLAP
jgi:hypothetical protein